MSTKIFPESPGIPSFAGQANKFLSNDGNNLIWNQPYAPIAFSYNGSSSGTLLFSGLPKCDTIIFIASFSASMTTQTLTLNSDSSANYTYSYAAWNGSSSSSGTGNTINTSTSSITLATAFGSFSSMQLWLRIDGCSTNGQKTITSMWQDGSGNGLSLATWNGSEVVNSLQFAPGGTTYGYRIVGY